MEAVLDTGFSQFAFACDKSACVEWYRVLGVDDYVVVPYEDALATNGIVLQQSGPSESLPKAALRQTGSLSCDDVERLCRHYNLISAGFGWFLVEGLNEVAWDWNRPSH